MYLKALDVPQTKVVHIEIKQVDGTFTEKGPPSQWSQGPKLKNYNLLID